MTYNDYCARRDEFKAALGHGCIKEHLHKITDRHVQLTRWRKYVFTRMTPRQIKRVGNVVGRRIRTQRSKENRKELERSKFHKTRGEAFQLARENISA